MENLDLKMQEKPLKITLAILRFIMAVEFLWAFLDKLLGLGFATKPEGAWIRGGSPTFGFLAKGSTGPFAGIFQAIGGKGIIDWLFMLALVVNRCCACSWYRNEDSHNFRFSFDVFHVGRFPAKTK